MFPKYDATKIVNRQVLTYVNDVMKLQTLQNSAKLKLKENSNL